MLINYFVAGLFICFPVFVVSGVFLSSFSLSILAVYGLIFSLNKKNRYIYKNNFIRIFLIFYFYILVRSLYSIDPLLSLESSLLYIRFIYFSIAIFFIIDFNKKILNYFGYSLIFTLLIVSLDSLIQLYYGKNILGWVQEDPYRVSSFFREELIMGSFISRLMPLAIILFSMFLNQNSKFYQPLLIIIIITFSVSIFISGERTAFFYLILISLLFIIFIPKLRLSQFLSIIIFCIAGFSYANFNPELKTRMFNETFKQMNVNSGVKNIKVFSEHHERLYFSAFKMFQSNPFFGQGPKTFRKLCSLPKYNPGACSTHPHNTYLQLLAELGLVGSLFVIVLLFYVLTEFSKIFVNIYFKKRNFENNELKVALLICILISIWPLSPSANFFSSWINNFYYLPIGIYLFVINQKT